MGGVFFLVLGTLWSLSYYANSKAPPPIPGQKPVFTAMQLAVLCLLGCALLVAAGGNFYAAANIDDEKTVGYLIAGCLWLTLAAGFFFNVWYAIRNNRRVLGRPFR